MKKLIACLAVSTVLFTGCTFMQGEKIIKVNDSVITQAEFDKELDKAIDNHAYNLSIKKINVNDKYKLLKEDFEGIV